MQELPEKLVAYARVIVGRFEFDITNEEDNKVGAPVSLSVTHTDQLASSLKLTVWDVNNRSDDPYPIFNALPDPILEHKVPVRAWMWWEKETPVLVFDGLLRAIEVRTQLTYTTIHAAHDNFLMRKRGKIAFHTNITIRQLFVKLAAATGQTVEFKGAAASDPILDIPMPWTMQGGAHTETAWGVFKHYCETYGFIANTTKKNVIEIRHDKSEDGEFTFTRGDDKCLSLTSRREQKRDQRSSRVKGHAHDSKPGKRYKKQENQSKDGARNVIPVPPRVGKRSQTPHRWPFARGHVKARARRQAVEEAEMTFTLRLEPRMMNIERLVLSKYGPKLDGAWQTAEVEHSIGEGGATTRAACWKKAAPSGGGSSPNADSLVEGGIPLTFAERQALARELLGTDDAATRRRRAIAKRLLEVELTLEEKIALAEALFTELEMPLDDREAVARLLLGEFNFTEEERRELIDILIESFR